MSESNTVTARNAPALVREIYDAIVLGNDIIISTNSPAVSAVIVDAISKYDKASYQIARNEKFSMTAVASFLATSIELKGGQVKYVTIAPKSIQIGTRLPANTTRIIVDDAGVFLGEVMAQIEFMKDGM